MVSPLDQLLDEAKRLDAAATKGPWEKDRLRYNWEEFFNDDKSYEQSIDDAAFIAFSREALPKLVAIVERQREFIKSKHFAALCADDVMTPLIYDAYKCLSDIDRIAEGKGEGA